MPTGPNGQKRPVDAIGLAVHNAKIATRKLEQTTLTQSVARASRLAREKARQENTTEAQRREIAERRPAAARLE